jgi:hypothetical protein
MTVDEIVKDRKRPYFRARCESIKQIIDLGVTLRPSLSPMFPPRVSRGPNVVFDCSEAALLARDRELSEWSLGWLKSLRSDYPELATEFGPVLTKAEQVWRGCAAA